MKKFGWQKLEKKELKKNFIPERGREREIKYENAIHSKAINLIDELVGYSYKKKILNIMTDRQKRL